MKKRTMRIMALLLAAGMTFSGMGFSVLAEEETAVEQESGVDTSMIGSMAFAQCDEYVNIRTEASTDGAVTGKIYNNCAAMILDRSGDWYKIKSGNATGYVSADYFAIGEEAEAIAEEVAYNVAKVHPEALMVRALPDETSDVVDMAQQSQELEVIGQEGDWTKVAMGGDVYGYVNSYYVEYRTYYAVAETVEEEQARLAQEAAAAGETYTAPENTETTVNVNQGTDVNQETAETEPAYEEPVETEPTYEEPVETEPAYEEPVETEPTYEEPVETEPVYEEPVETEPVYEEPVETEPVYEEPVETEPVYEEPVETEPVYEEPVETEPVYEEPVETEPVYEEPVETEPTYEEPVETEPTYEETEPSTSGLGQQIADFAVQFVGNPYVYGGTSLTGGADCSGFTQSVFASFGIALNRTAADQSYGGTAVDLGSIQAGDLLFYSDGGGISHVALYIGGGQIVHASTPESGIIISNAYYSTPVAARRYW